MSDESWQAKLAEATAKQQELFGPPTWESVPRNQGIRTEYLDPVFDGEKFQQTLKLLELAMAAYRADFDAIAFTGVSGAAVAFPLSDRLKAPLLCVRKKGENAHFAGTLEGYIYASRYCIVDDQISSGRTLERIIREVRQNAQDYKSPPPTLTHVFLYHPRRSRRPEWLPETVQLHDLGELNCP